MSMKNFVLGVGIFLIYILAVVYGIQAFYPAPAYDDYCDEFDGFLGKIGDSCDVVPGLTQKQIECSRAGGTFRGEYDNNGCLIGGECDECSIEYQTASEEYGKSVFIIALVVGILTLIVGFAILSLEPVGSALMAGGIGTIVYGSIRNWENLSNVWRFLLLVVALLFLIWLAFKLNDGGGKFWKRFVGKK